MAQEVLSVIVTDRTDSTIISIESVTTSEKDIDRENKIARFDEKFSSLCKENGVNEHEIEDCMEDGYAIGEANVISIVWS